MVCVSKRSFIRTVNRRKKHLNLTNLHFDNSWWSVKKNVNAEKLFFEKMCVCDDGLSKNRGKVDRGFDSVSWD